MLDKLVAKHVTENLQWFFDKYLKDHYDRRRETLIESTKHHEIEQELIPAIDYVLKICVGPQARYPPDNFNLWHEYYHKLSSGYSCVFQQMLLIYLKLDLANYLAIRERESTTGRQTRTKDKAELSFLQTTFDRLIAIPRSLDFKASIVKFSTGLWALDNEQMNLTLSCLSDPSIDFTNYFESPKQLVQLIVGTLHCSDNSRMALYMSRVHRCEGWDEEYDQLHAYLLIRSGQLVEALKYERMFIDQDNYQEILQHFFELCSRLEVTKALNCLNLSIEEEEVWNHHLSEQSRSVTPSVSGGAHQTRQVPISTPVQNHSFRTPNTSGQQQQNSIHGSTPKHTPRNRNVQALRKVPSFNDSPARNTRSARKKKSDK